MIVLNLGGTIYRGNDRTFTRTESLKEHLFGDFNSEDYTHFLKNDFVRSDPKRKLMDNVKSCKPVWLHTECVLHT